MPQVATHSNPIYRETYIGCTCPRVTMPTYYMWPLTRDVRLHGGLAYSYPGHAEMTATYAGNQEEGKQANEMQSGNADPIKPVTQGEF